MNPPWQRFAVSECFVYIVVTMFLLGILCSRDLCVKHVSSKVRNILQMFVVTFHFYCVLLECRTCVIWSEFGPTHLCCNADMSYIFCFVWLGGEVAAVSVHCNISISLFSIYIKNLTCSAPKSNNKNNNKSLLTFRQRVQPVPQGKALHNLQTRTSKYQLQK